MYELIYFSVVFFITFYLVPILESRKLWDARQKVILLREVTLNLPCFRFFF